jgi:hypothetical protein
VDDVASPGLLGLTMPTPEYLIGAIVFSFVGFAAYRYGKRLSRPYPKWIGIGLMLYPYAVAQTWMLYAVGIGLCASLFYFRD